MDAHAYITDLAVALPGAPVPNDGMEALLGLVGGKPSRARRIILKSNGIESRHYAIDPATGEPTHTVAQLAAEAVRKLGGGKGPGAVDVLACAATMADQLMPGHASMVHGELGLPPCETMSSAGVCVSGVTALKYAAMAVKGGEAKRAVACASEVPSIIMRGKFYQTEMDAQIRDLEARPELAFDKDFLRWMLSDGAGAALIEPQPAAQGLSLRIDWVFQRSYANEMDACMVAGAEKQADGSLKAWHQFEPAQWAERSIFNIKQDVKQLNEHIVEFTLTRALKEAAAAKGLKAADVDFFLPHYSSTYFRERAYQGLKDAGFEIPLERWFTNLTRKGNTGSASIYIILEELLRSGRLKAGQRLLCWVPESGRFSAAFMQLTVCENGSR